MEYRSGSHTQGVMSNDHVAYFDKSTTKRKSALTASPWRQRQCARLERELKDEDIKHYTPKGYGPTSAGYAGICYRVTC